MLAARHFGLFLWIVPLACGDASQASDGGARDRTDGSTAERDASTRERDASLENDDSASMSSDGDRADNVELDAADAGADRKDTASDTAGEVVTPGEDGPPNRQPCTSAFGTALTQAFGRLDGFLVAVIIPGQATCNPDNDHVYLQISVNHATYQIAANVHSTQGGPGGSDVLYLEKPLAALPDGPWTEGWHTAQIAFDYVGDAGVHASDFASTPLSALAVRVEDRLVNVNHISVFATGFGPDGAHLIHRNGSGHDGAIITEPLSSSPHALMFHFDNQSF